MVHQNRLNGGPAPGYSNGDAQDGDLEAGRRRLRPPRFRDAVNLAVKNTFHAELKRKLKDGVDHDGLEKYRKSVTALESIKDKKVRRFYEEQNNRLNDWLEVDAIVSSMADDVLDSMNVQDADGDGIPELGGRLKMTGGNIDPLLPDDERERRIQAERKAKWAININVIANILLLLAKAIAAASSSSLSLIASLVDSALDLLCTLIIWTTNKLVQRRIRRLQLKFPVGRRRLEPLGILTFSIIMIVSFLQILQESVSKLLPSASHEAATLPPTAIGALAATVGVKGLIWIWCAGMSKSNTQVAALAQDCKTDVYFNTISLIFPLLGHSLNIWWLDPVGAGVLSLFIIYDWAQTLIEQVSKLTGVAVDEDLKAKVLMMGWRFAPVVQAYKSVVAYHAGDGIWVEMEIMMGEQERLGRCHDVAETMQYCLEGLREVDRAFVTVDCKEFPCPAQPTFPFFFIKFKFALLSSFSQFVGHLAYLHPSSVWSITLHEPTVSFTFVTGPPRDFSSGSGSNSQIDTSQGPTGHQQN